MKAVAGLAIMSLVGLAYGETDMAKLFGGGAVCLLPMARAEWRDDRGD